MKKDREKLDLAPAHTAWAELDAALQDAENADFFADERDSFCLGCQLVAC
jgi:hypothetical protein